MVECLKTCGLLCALLTTFVVCQASDNYECDVSLPDLKKPPQPEICEMALYELSFDFKLKEDNKNKLPTYSNKTIKYDININTRTDRDIRVPTQMFTGFPSKDQPLYFMTNHSSIVKRMFIIITQNITEEILNFAKGDAYDMLLTNHLCGHVHVQKNNIKLRITPSDINDYAFEESEPMSVDRVRYPRCLVFATNSVKPDVIYGGCINEMGFLYGSNICVHNESGLEFTIQTIDPTSDDLHSCSNRVEDWWCPPNCKESVIESAKKNAQYQMLDQLKTTTTKTSTTELEYTTTQNQSTTTQTTTTTSAPAPTPATCKPELGEPIGFIVGMTVALVLLLGSVAGNIFQKLQARKLSAEYDQRGVAVKAWELENVRLNKEIDVLRPLCGLEDPEDYKDMSNKCEARPEEAKQTQPTEQEKD